LLTGVLDVDGDGLQLAIARGALGLCGAGIDAELGPHEDAAGLRTAPFPCLLIELLLLQV
jgi:hypothetical protein